MNRFDDKFKKADDSFNNKYSKEIDGLKGLTDEEIKSVTHDVSNYDSLLEVVEEASKKNISQAELVTNINNLGKAAVDLAKKVPILKELF